jgi:hypothetical protein
MKHTPTSEHQSCKETHGNMSENQTDTTNENMSEQSETQIPDAQSMTAHPPKRKKKSKKKGANKGIQKGSGEALQASVSAPVSSQAEPLTEEDHSLLESHIAAPQTIINLPVKPDEWFIQPATYDNEGNLLTEETFTFLKDGIEVITMPLNENNFGGLSHLLKERFADEEENTTADYFHVRKPLSDSEESDPVMTLTQRNRILATTSLDQKTLKKLIRALQKHVEQKSPVTTWLNNWWGKHKILRVLLIIAALPLAAMLLYTIIWGATH